MIFIFIFPPPALPSLCNYLKFQFNDDVPCVAEERLPGGQGLVAVLALEHHPRHQQNLQYSTE